MAKEDGIWDKMELVIVPCSLQRDKVVSSTFLTT